MYASSILDPDRERIGKLVLGITDYLDVTLKSRSLTPYEKALDDLASLLIRVIPIGYDDDHDKAHWKRSFERIRCTPSRLYTLACTSPDFNDSLRSAVFSLSFELDKLSYINTKEKRRFLFF
jgi:hypothetical protein